MAVSTNIADIGQSYSNLYDDVCSHVAIMIKTNQKARVILGGDPPTPGNPEFFVISGGSDTFTGYRLVMSFDNLEAGDAIWVRAESGTDQLMVIRGNVEIRGNR